MVICMDFRERQLPVGSTYNDLDDVPSDIKKLLTIYDSVNGRNAIYQVERVHELLDEFANQQCYVTDESEEDGAVLLAVANYRQKIEEGFGWIEGLAVAPYKREMGVGRFVINQLVTVAQQNNLHELRLQSIPSAVPFYEKQQFSIMDGEENKSHPKMSRPV